MARRTRTKRAVEAAIRLAGFDVTQFAFMSVSADVRAALDYRVRTEIGSSDEPGQWVVTLHVSAEIVDGNDEAVLSFATSMVFDNCSEGDDRVTAGLPQSLVPTMLTAAYGATRGALFVMTNALPGGGLLLPLTQPGLLLAGADDKGHERGC